jgi:hypothetical protein
VVEHLPSQHETLSLIFSPEKKTKTNKQQNNLLRVVSCVLAHPGLVTK